MVREAFGQDMRGHKLHLAAAQDEIQTPAPAELFERVLGSGAWSRDAQPGVFGEGVQTPPDPQVGVEVPQDDGCVIEVVNDASYMLELAPAPTVREGVEVHIEQREDGPVDLELGLEKTLSPHTAAAELHGLTAAGFVARQGGVAVDQRPRSQHLAVVPAVDVLEVGGDADVPRLVDAAGPRGICVRFLQRDEVSVEALRESADRVEVLFQATARDDELADPTGAAMGDVEGGGPQRAGRPFWRHGRQRWGAQEGAADASERHTTPGCGPAEHRAGGPRVNPGCCGRPPRRSPKFTPPHTWPRCPCSSGLGEDSTLDGTGAAPVATRGGAIPMTPTGPT